ncbi:serine/threonine-protein kinase [Streptomyces flavalbus]|uniref:Serine/threonine-protein kinase n=1 Tax=Streptomyces flavalbus TaxID=2665155 RepID=A0ABW2WCS9_9ACTN
MAPQRNIGAGAEAELPEYAGHYRLESTLGSGGMGVVHLARSTSGMKLAVKVVHAEFARDPEFRGRFRQEVAAARRVSGAFTAPVVDADPEAARPWMATLFIPGPTLAEQVKRNGSLAPEQLRRLMAGLAEALRDIHRVGVVHRDLKPSNVLLADDGPKVIDFGISRPKDSELRTETGKLIGTPPFMAPEQFRRPREVGPAADVFALGSVMVHAATGRGPFDSDSPYVVAYQVVHDEPDVTGVPEGLAPLILRCLAKEPEERPTPDELMRELRSVAASYDTQVFIPAQRDGGDSGATGSEPRPAEGPGKDAKRSPSGRSRWWRAALVAAVLGLVTVGGLVSVRLTDSGDPAPTRSGTRTAPAAFSGWETGSVSGAASMPQCSYGAGKLLCAQPGVVFAIDPSDGAVLWRHSVEETDWSGAPILSGGLVQPLTGTATRLEGLDPASGKARWERRAPASSSTAAAGGMLLFTASDGTVTGVDSSSGDTQWSRRIPGLKAPYFSSFAGDRLAYATSTSYDGANTVVTAVDPVTGDVRWEEELEGTLEPVGAEDGSVFFLSVTVSREAVAVVRYTPGSREPQSVALPVQRLDAAATVRGDVVYLLSAGGALEAVDMARGKRLWSLETSAARGSVPVADGRHVYASFADGRLLAADARNGELVGQTRPRLAKQANRVAAGLPAPVLAQGRVYAGAPDGTVFAVDAREPSRW